MVRRFSMLMLALLWLPAGSRGDGDSDKKKATDARTAEVRLGDGSIVRVIILQANIEVATRFDKMTIPTSDLRRIDFALHLTPERARQIDDAIKMLGSDNFKQREDAGKELLSLGEDAYPAAQAAAKSPEQEIARRAQAVVDQLRAKLPEERLHIRPYDTILTSDFPMTGRILSPTIKVRTTYFGDQELKLSDLRSLRLLVAGNEEEVAVDAAKYGSATGQWLNTGVTINAQSRLKITASGDVDLWPQTPGQYMTGPQGYNPGQLGVIGPRAVVRGNATPPGLLVGRIGENGPTIVIGERYEGPAREEGMLFLHIGPSPWNNASTGSYKVKIAVNAD